MKRKSLTMILCLLTCLSLVGVGFAAWVISAPDSHDVTGNITVDTVSDKRLDLTVAPNDLSIYFGGKNDTTPLASTAWLTTEETKVAVLSVTFACTVIKQSGEEFSLKENAIEELTISVIFAAPDNDEYDTAKTNECFIEPENISASNVKISGDKKTVTFDVTVTYEWGEAFGGKNPFNFYNDGAHGVNAECGLSIPNKTKPTWGDHAAYYLGLLDAMDTNAETLNYELTIQVDATGTTALSSN